MNTDFDDREFQLWNDIQAQKDPEGAEFRRKQHERWRKVEEREKRISSFLDDALKVTVKVLKWVSAAAIAFFVERLLSKYVI